MMSLLSLSRSAIPEYLHTSEFYLGLDADDEGQEVQIPENCFKTDTDVKNSDDLTLLLSTLRFWGVSTIPKSVIRYVVWHKPVEVIDAFVEFEQELTYVRFLRALCNGTDSCSGQGGDAMKAWLIFRCDQRALEYSTFERAAQLCVYQYEHHGGKVWSARTCALAAELPGEPAVLRFLHEHGCPWDARCCEKAAESGHLPCLQYAHERGCPWDSKTCAAAAKSDNVACLQYAHAHGCAWDAQAYERAEYNGACCRYLLENGCPDGEGSMNAAAQAGDLQRVKALHEKGCAWSEHTSIAAVKGGHLPVLKFLHEHGCPLHANVGNMAIAYGSIECLRYAGENGVVFDENELTTSLKFWRTTEYFRYLVDHPGCDKIAACIIAAQYQSVEALQYAVERGGNLVAEVTKYAAGSGSLDCLKYAHEKGCPWYPSTCKHAARASKVEHFHFHFRAIPLIFDLTQEIPRPRVADNLGCLRYAHEHGSAWGAATCTAAAQSGDLACLRYAHEHGCPWDEATCIGATQKGDLPCLQYAHEHGCPWGAAAAVEAVQSGSLECLRYLHEHGCEWPWWWFRHIVKTPRNRKCLEYALEHLDRFPAVTLPPPTECTGCGYVPPPPPPAEPVDASLTEEAPDEGDAWQVVGKRGRVMRVKPCPQVSLTATSAPLQPTPVASLNGEPAEMEEVTQPLESIPVATMPTFGVSEYAPPSLAPQSEQPTAGEAEHPEEAPWTLVRGRRGKRT